MFLLNDAFVYFIIKIMYKQILYYLATMTYNQVVILADISYLITKSQDNILPFRIVGTII